MTGEGGYSYRTKHFHTDLYRVTFRLFIHHPAPHTPQTNLIDISDLYPYFPYYTVSIHPVFYHSRHLSIASLRITAIAKRAGRVRFFTRHPARQRRWIDVETDPHLKDNYDNGLDAEWTTASSNCCTQNSLGRVSYASRATCTRADA